MPSESPFLAYIKTNDVPSALEVDGIASLIEDRKEAASGIRARLDSRNGSIEEVHGKKREGRGQVIS